MEDYRTIHGTATGEYEEKKSRFIAALSFADSEEAAVAFLEQVRAANRTARHNVYAYRLREGNRERYSDDGEPAKDGAHTSAGGAAAQRPDGSDRGGDPLFWRRAAGHRRLGACIHHGYGPCTGKCQGGHGAQRGGAARDSGLLP